MKIMIRDTVILIVSENVVHIPNYIPEWNSCVKRCFALNSLHL